MKKPYEKPQIRDWGTVAELTATGKTNPGNDLKSGSAASQGQ
ncbi:MAG: lasso RiPP family leader peptide-containing protein [Gemmatimonadetes bacterium]|nr:lasso RiPP family leader peptide-containing protein [Gemmatimonadota bacterium]